MLLDWPPVLSMVTLCGIALVYTLLGGFRAVVITDSAQFLIMCLILALAVPFALRLIGGFDAMYEVLEPTYFEQMGDLSLWLIFVYAGTNLVVLIAVQGAIDPNVVADQSLIVIMRSVLPVGALGFFVAGVLATEMSTMDSYCLVAGGNVAYDVYRPLVNPEATDAELIRMTRVGVLASWVVGFLMAVSFEQMLGLWVFLASILISTALVPILLGLYVPAWRKPLAGLLGSTLGLMAVVGVNAAIVLMGRYVEADETYVLTVQVGGAPREI